MCTKGSYGQDCKVTCNYNCDGCNNVNGYCDRGCKPGWKGENCQERNVSTQGKLTRINSHEIHANFMRILRMKKRRKQTNNARRKHTIFMRILHDFMRFLCDFHLKINFTRFSCVKYDIVNVFSLSSPLKMIVVLHFNELESQTPKNSAKL